MLQFDAETTRLLEHAYRGSDVVKRRLATLEALAPRPGATIVDVGSGPGHLTVPVRFVEHGKRETDSLQINAKVEL